jgi:aminoglycoside/choline kinase family phosphotransferase
MSTTELLPTPIQKWLSEKLSSQTMTVYQLAGDASARRYYRVVDKDKTWVLMCWEPFVAKDYPFLSVQKHFASCGVEVPAIVAVGAELGVLLLDDLGDLTLERKFWEASKQESSSNFYFKTLDELIKIHDLATYSDVRSTASVTEFDTAKFLWEMNYAKEHLLLGLLKLNLDAATLKDLDQVFINFCEKLHQEPKVICHRDFHSRNIMIHRDKVCVIDFQDARMGPVQYDLVSLLKDSYVDINDSYAQTLMNYYLDHSNVKKTKNYNSEKFMKIYELQSLQRCFKACGSFASFMNTRQDRRYLKYLKPTLRRVLNSLEAFPEYKLLHRLLIDSGALEMNFETMP